MYVHVSHSISIQSVSGGVAPSQRYSEQLVLYAKAVSILDSGLRRFQIEMATSSMELDQTLRTGECMYINMHL